MILIIVFLLLNGLFLSAQNIGLNTNSPQATLDVRGTSRFGGGFYYTSHDSVTGRIVWNNSRLYVPTPQQLIAHSASAEGLFYNYNALEYRNQFGVPVFSTNWSADRSYFTGNVGIGTVNPLAKLHVQTGSSGSSIFPGNIISESSGNNFLSFYTPDASASSLIFSKQSMPFGGGITYNDYFNPDGINFKTNSTDQLLISANGNVAIGGGNPSAAKLHIYDGPSGYSGGYFFGITLEGNANRYINIIAPPQTLNGIIFRKSDTAEAGFVYDSPATPNGIQFRTDVFRSRMLLSDVGYLGIGNTNPGYMLDVNNRMRIRSGGDGFTSAGIWFNNNANTEAAFMGMQDNTNLGFWGNTGGGWKLTMNTQTRTLSFNGSTGTNNYVLTSMGPAAPPEWRSPTKFLYDNTQMRTQTSDIVMTSSTPATPIPNLSFSFTVTGNAKVIVSSSLCVIQLNNLVAPNGSVFVDLQLNGSFVTQMSEGLDKGNVIILRNDFIVSVPAGTHTIRLVANTPPQDLIIYGTGTMPSNVVFKVIPE